MTVLSACLCSDRLSVGEVVPDAAVEHASVEVDALVPRSQTVAPLHVDQILVLVVVGLYDVLPSVLIEEIVSCSCHVLEKLIGICAIFHRVAVVWLGIANRPVATVIHLIIVLVVGAAELDVKSGVLY